MTKRFAVLFLILFALVGCGKGRHKKVYGKVYQSASGNYYTRSWQNDQFVYWMFIDSGSPTSTGTGYFSGGSWIRAQAPISELKPTQYAVEEEEGVPTDDVEESANIEGDVIDESTTEAEAEADTADSSDAGDSGDSGGDAGGDSGGGGDGGGGGC